MRRRSAIVTLLAGAALLLGACTAAPGGAGGSGAAKPAADPPAKPAAQGGQAAAKPGAATEDVAAFYRGKTITLIVSASAGGGYDLYARVLAEHMKKHIPGNPNIIVQNMTGGGGLVAGNHLYNSARKDGTVISSNNRGIAQAELAGVAEVQYKSREFYWLGSMNEEVSVCGARADTGITRFEDLYTRPLRIGGTGPGADTDFFPMVLNVILGTRFDIISGYPGGTEINLGVERGELQGRCGWSWSSVVSTREEWIKEPRFFNVLIQMALNKHKDERLKDVPLVTELARSDADREVMALLFSRQTMGRPFFAPPGVPPARAQALREAFAKTMADPELQRDMDKAKLELNPVSGEQVQQLIERMFNARPEVLERFRKVYQEAGGGT